MQRPLVRLVLLLVLVLAAQYSFRQASQRGEDAAPERTPPGLAEQDGDAAGDATSRAELGPCEVTRVVDGDTLDVRCGAREERVRLLQVDAPERDDPLHAEAGAALEALLGGRPVALELGAEARDEQGRLLAYVFAGGENVNLALVRDGWSPVFDRDGPGAAPHEFAAAERAAREARRGIWALGPHDSGGIGEPR